jgi:hypothetical protein
MELPVVRDVNGIVLHAQDNINVANNNISPEIIAIEDFYQESNIQNIILIHWNHNLSEIYDGTLNLIEFPTHSFDFIQHFIQRYDEWNDVNNKTNTIKYMCLNGRPRKHRIMVYDYLKKMDIFPNVMSLGKVNDNIPSYLDYDFDNVGNFIKLLDVFKSSPVNVVTETLYYESKGTLTEKLLQAFGSLQLPIIIGHRGAVQDARDYGFDMFDDIIDNSFDNMPNISRWKYAIDSNIHVLRNEFNYDDLLPRLKRNQYYLLNGYLDKIVNGFQNQTNEMFLKMNENH